MKIIERIRAKRYIMKMQDKGYVQGQLVQTAIQEFNQYRKLSDFMSHFVAEYEISYYDIPSEFRKDIKFLASVCNNNIKMINDLHANLLICEFFNLVENISNLSTVLASRDIKPVVKNEIRRYLKARQKVQSCNKNINKNVSI